MSCLMTYRTTENLESWEIRKYQENLKISYNYCLVVSPPEIKALSALAKIS